MQRRQFRLPRAALVIWLLLPFAVVALLWFLINKTGPDARIRQTLDDPQQQADQSEEPSAPPELPR